MSTAFHDSAGANLSMAPWSTLGAALAGLGHECVGGCPDLVTDWPATLWFVRLLGTTGGPSARTLVEVEFTHPPFSTAQLRLLLRDVNHCIQHDYIQVSERRGRDPAS